ncbi:hypothetical protein [Burkholderia sp. Ac-20365]|uniref:hypothetical protein n=1 Tax=Burkholderia sp. Ac-20365 TaxID=2703897 RepID=UPI00197B835E|nr:hypothetical protein [Burkholderia sp. Ac-20365]MBN3761303.1 hypothetical protein [Burkholderia sp. Ac-20365]
MKLATVNTETSRVLMASDAKNAADIGRGYALAMVLGIRTGDDFDSVGVDAIDEWAREAYALGALAGPGGSVPEVFKGTRLASEWLAGQAHSEEEGAHEVFSEEAMQDRMFETPICLPTFPAALH